MSSPITAFRGGRGVVLADPVAARERSVRRRVGLTWGLLFLNALGFVGFLVPIPGVIGKMVTQGALSAALVVALTVNRRVVVRPNVFLCLVSLLPAEAVLTALQPQYLGALYRTSRLIEFCAVLWLLTPWWGLRDLLLVRYHLITLGVILGSVVLGLLVAPGSALVQGRLSGALWQIPATQTAHYAAVTAGLVIVLWLGGYLGGRITLLIFAVACTVLLLTRTRTALVGMTAGVLVAGLSLIVAKARVRRLFAIGGAVAAVVILTLSSLITTFLARGEGAQQLTQLTGRTKVWGPLLSFPRDRFQEIFGFGLSNSSFGGLPIDSNWLSSYQNQGLFGVSVCVALLVFLLVAAYFQPRGVHRALALFLVTYCLVASFTEDGFTDVTPYLLELVLAASLLVPPAVDRGPP
ncbi:MAG: O-antigen ligase domain-containing protein [Actinomycetota bacterium]